MTNEISRDNPVPLYWQLAETIKQQISAGELKPGDQLPTEQWLSETFQLSRVTVRRAVQLLIDNQVLCRKRGESPTVTYPHMSRQVKRLTSLSEDLIKMGFVPSAKTLFCDRIAAPLNVALQLNIKMGDPVLRLTRVRYADDAPIAIHDCFYPSSICGAFLTPEFQGLSIYRFLAENGVVLASAHQRVTACCATESDASLMEIPVGSALLHIERVSATAEGALIEFSDMLYNPLRYDLSMELIC